MKRLRIKRILVPTDFSEAGTLAFEYSVQLARMCKAEIYLLHVIESPNYSHSMYHPEVMVRWEEDTDELVHDQLQKVVNEIKSRYTVYPKMIVERGNVTAGIARVAGKRKADLIIMGAHGRRGFGDYTIGSNAGKTLAKSNCKVITLRQSSRLTGFKSIVMPVDDSNFTMLKADHMVKWAKKFKSQIHSLELLDPTEEIDEEIFEMKIEKAEHVFQKEGVNYVRRMIRSTHLAEEAVHYAESVDADLIAVLKSHESSSGVLSRHSEKILDHSTIPVLSIPAMTGTEKDRGLFSEDHSFFYS